MKRIFITLLSAFAFLLTQSCDNNQNENAKPKILSSIDSLPVQTFVIDAEKHSVLQGKNGSSFLFPAGSLEDSSGASVKGNVEITLIEVNTIEDFVKSGITTESDGKLLASDGSYYINASSEGKTLRVKNGKEIYARLPTRVKDPEMKFFTGEKTEDGNINWKVDSSAKLISEQIPATFSAKAAKNVLPKTKKAQPTLNISDAQRSELFAEYNDISLYLHDNIYNDETKYVKLGGWYIPEEEADRIVRSKYGVSYSEYQPFNYPDKGNKLESIEKDISATPFRYKASIVEARDRRYKELNKMLGIQQPDKPVQFSRKEKKINIKREENESWEDFIHRQDEAYKEKFGTQAYLYALNKFGWINCDKFVNQKMMTYSGKILDANNNPAVSPTEIHLISRKERIHLKNISREGSYTFNYPAEKSFDIVFIYGREEISKTFDGTQATLEDIRLSVQQ